MSSTARFTLAALLTTAITAVGCTNALDVHEREDAAGHDIAFAAQDNDLLNSLVADEEGWSSSPVFEREEAFGRVALRYDAFNDVRVQVRAEGAAGWGAWQDVTVTFSDEGAHNAHVDVAADSFAAQVRFDDPDAAGLSFLAIETFTLDEVSDDGSDVQVATSEALTQGLAADGVAVTRAQWGARSRSCGPTHRPNRITIHHTVTPNNDSMSMPARMRQIQAYHIDSRGWCDMGYHFFIGQDGKVYQGRVETILGAHVANDNSNNVGISFIGTYSSVAPSDAMFAAGARIIKSLSTTYGITIDRTKVKGHRQSGTTQTECPGNALYARLQTLVDRAKGTTTTTPPTTTPPTTTPPATGSDSFTDVPSSHFAYAAIEKLKARGVVSGCTSTTFCPNEKITRGQMALIIDRLMPTGSVDLSGVPSFTDVESTYRAAAREAVARGIMERCSTGGFCSSGSVTRASIAVYAVRARNFGNLTVSTATFGDVPRSYWASGAVERLWSRNMITGCSTSPRNFCPADDVTRAQAAVILVNAFGL
ncbi:MAG TPA: N-acetylmuramoyl-L-alanine amidase [Myxococcota bacterium]